GFVHVPARAEPGLLPGGFYVGVPEPGVVHAEHECRRVVDEEMRTVVEVEPGCPNRRRRGNQRRHQDDRMLFREGPTFSLLLEGGRVFFLRVSDRTTHWLAPAPARRVRLRR